MTYVAKLRSGGALEVDEDNLGDSVDAFEETTDLYADSHIRPKISTEDETVIPAYVKNVHGMSNPNSKQNKDLCGNEESEQIGDGTWHVTIEGILTIPQFDALNAMQPQTNAVTVQTTAIEEEIIFDRFSIDEKDGMNGGQFSFDGFYYVGPLVEFQLQSRQKKS